LLRCNIHESECFLTKKYYILMVIRLLKYWKDNYCLNLKQDKERKVSLTQINEKLDHWGFCGIPALGNMEKGEWKLLDIIQKHGVSNFFDVVIPFLKNYFDLFHCFNIHSYPVSFFNLFLSFTYSIIFFSIFFS